MFTGIAGAALILAATSAAGQGSAVKSAAGVRTEGITETTLYNASAIVSLTDRTAMFGSWVTGLEEAGIAPTSAINRDEVLPPVQAEQFELGVRHAITPGLTFSGALFEVSKPTHGLRADRSFGLVGEVRHRDVEGSIAGRLDAKTSEKRGQIYFHTLAARQSSLRNRGHRSSGRTMSSQTVILSPLASLLKQTLGRRE